MQTHSFQPGCLRLRRRRSSSPAGRRQQQRTLQAIQAQCMQHQPDWRANIGSHKALSGCKITSIIGKDGGLICCMYIYVHEAREVMPTKKSSLQGILPLLLSFRRSMAQPGQPSTASAAAGGSSSGADSEPISTKTICFSHLVSCNAKPLPHKGTVCNCSSICSSIYVVVDNSTVTVCLHLEHEYSYTASIFFSL